MDVPGPDLGMIFIILFEKYFFYHDAPAAEGFSGGPILNGGGEVVSIQSSGTGEGGFGLNRYWIGRLEAEYEPGAARPEP